MTVEDTIRTLAEHVEGAKSCMELTRSAAEDKTCTLLQVQSVAQAVAYLLSGALEIIADLQLTCEKAGISDRERETA